MAGDPSLAKGDLFGAADFGALTLFECPHEFSGLQHAVRRAGVKPGKSTPHTLNLQLTLLEIGTISLAVRLQATLLFG